MHIAGTRLSQGDRVSSIWTVGGPWILGGGGCWGEKRTGDEMGWGVTETCEGGAGYCGSADGLLW